MSKIKNCAVKDTPSLWMTQTRCQTALSSHVDDVRNVPASSIQAAVGLPELLAEIETYCPVAE